MVLLVFFPGGVWGGEIFFFFFEKKKKKYKHVDQFNLTTYTILRKTVVKFSNKLETFYKSIYFIQK